MADFASIAQRKEQTKMLSDMLQGIESNVFETYNEHIGSLTDTWTDLFELERTLAKAAYEFQVALTKYRLDRMWIIADQADEIREHREAEKRDTLGYGPMNHERI